MLYEQQKSKALICLFLIIGILSVLVWRGSLLSRSIQTEEKITDLKSGNMFVIDWTYNEYRFAVYGKSPQDTSDRDMAGKIALAIIYNLRRGEDE